MVLALGIRHPGTLDAEDRHALAVHAPDLDVAQLAAADEAEGSQEEILGLKHRRLLKSYAHGLVKESSAIVGLIEVGSVSPLISGRRRDILQDRPAAGPSFSSPNRPRNR